jgi:hypothetical protein
MTRFFRRLFYGIVAFLRGLCFAPFARDASRCDDVGGRERRSLPMFCGAPHLGHFGFSGIDSIS